MNPDRMGGGQASRRRRVVDVDRLAALSPLLVGPSWQGPARDAAREDRRAILKVRPLRRAAGNPGPA